MSSSSGPSSKGLNAPVSAAPATFHSTSPANDSGYQRRPGGSGSFGAGLTSRTAPSARKNQSRKSQHKRQRPPRLLDDDEYCETVRVLVFHLLVLLFSLFLVAPEVVSPHGLDC